MRTKPGRAENVGLGIFCVLHKLVCGPQKWLLAWAEAAEGAACQMEGELSGDRR